MKMYKWITFVFCFATLNVFAQPQGEVVDRIIGTVGNEIILQSDLENELIRMKMQGIDPDQSAVSQIMEQLLFNKLLLHQARLDSLEVSEPQVQAEIDNRLNYYLTMFPSVEAFEEQYGKSLAQWKEDFRDDIRNQLLTEQMRYQVNSSVTATPKQVQEFFSELPKDSIPLISEKVQYSKIVLEPTPSQEDKEKLLALADSIRKDVTTGKMTMSIAALRHSDDPGSKYSGGCYKDIPKGNFVPEFEEAVFTTAVNDFSPVFESEYGYHFLKVTDKRGDIFSACHVLFSPKVDDEGIVRAQMKLDSIGVKIREDSLTFGRAALLYSTDEMTKNQYGRVPNEYEGGFEHNVDAIDRNLFLIINNLDLGEVSESVMLETPTGSPYFVIYRLDGRIPAHEANLKEDYLFFKQNTEAKLQEEKLDKWMRKRISGTYIRVHDDYKECEFNFPWLGNDS